MIFSVASNSFPRWDETRSRPRMCEDLTHNGRRKFPDFMYDRMGAQRGLDCRRLTMMIVGE